jgi:hypothetical protein
VHFIEKGKTPGFIVIGAKPQRPKPLSLSPIRKLHGEEKNQKSISDIRVESLSRQPFSSARFIFLYQKPKTKPPPLAKYLRMISKSVSSVSLSLFTLKLSVSVSLSLSKYFSQHSIIFPHFLALQTETSVIREQLRSDGPRRRRNPAPDFPFPEIAQKERGPNKAYSFSFTTRFSEIIGRFTFLDHMP